MHSDKLQVSTGVDEVKGVREPQLQPHQAREYECHQPNKYGSNPILDGNDFMILTPDIFGNKSLRIVHFVWLVGNCHMLHVVLPRLLERVRCLRVELQRVQVRQQIID